PQVALEVHGRDVVLDRAGERLLTGREGRRPGLVGDQRHVVGIHRAQDRVDPRGEVDRYVDAVALARDVPEQVRLAAGLAQDEVLGTLGTIGRAVALVDLGARRRDAQRE